MLNKILINSLEYDGLSIIIPAFNEDENIADTILDTYNSTLKI